LPRDFARAYMWASLAATGGNDVAAKNRDLIATKLTPQELVGAQRRARECQARAFRQCD